METGEGQPMAAREPNYFEQIENRVTQVWDRLQSVTQSIRLIVDELDGDEPLGDNVEKGVDAPNTIFGKISASLVKLENAAEELEYQKSRLEKLFK